jgi:hypothetical protein
MSRGTDEFTVQQLMNFIGEQMDDIENSMPEKYRNLGYAHINNVSALGSSAVTGRVDEIQKAQQRRNKLQELLWAVERKCVELYDKTPKLTDANGSD